MENLLLGFFICSIYLLNKIQLYAEMNVKAVIYLL